MNHTRLGPSFSFLIILLVAPAGFAQPQSGKPETGSLPAQENPAVGVKADSSTPLAASAPSAKTPEENAVISEPDHRVHINGGISVGGGYTHFSGLAVLPLYGGYGPWGYGYWGGLAPMGWSPFWYAYAPYAASGPGYAMGQVKFQVEPKTAEVLIDGAYAGTVASLKSNLWLEPGAYNLCIKSAGHADYCRRIYVLSGKNLAVLAKLPPVHAEVNP
jgi:hypothetical protein